MKRSISLLVRTNLVLAVSAVGIAVTAIVALNAFVIEPIAERSADDEAALLVLSAQTWVELPPGARPYFELELAQNHDLIISSEARSLPLACDGILRGLERPCWAESLHYSWREVGFLMKLGKEQPIPGPPPRAICAFEFPFYTGCPSRRSHHVSP